MVARPGVASGSSTVAVAAARRGPPRHRRSSLPNSRASPQVASPVRFPSTFPPPSMAIQQVESAEQFRELTAAAALSVACFSAPWCGGCKLVDPQVEALAKELSSLQFVKVNAEGMEALCEELEVASFPTFRVYKAGSSLGECISSKFDKVEEFIRAHAKRGDPPAEEADQLMPEAANEARPVVETDASISGAVTPLMGSETSDGENEEDDESPGKKRSERDEEEQDVEEPSPKKAKTEDEIVDEANAAALVVDSATDETSETMDTTEVASTSFGEISAEVEMTTNDGVGEPNTSEGEEEEGGGETAAANKIGDVVEPAAADDEGATNEMMEDDIIETDETASVEDVVADENEAVLVMDEGLIATQIPPAELLESVELSKITDEQTRTDASSKANDCATADKLPADNHDANESALDEVSVENAADATLSSDELLAQKLEQTESGTSVPLANGADPASADNAVAA